MSVSEDRKVSKVSREGSEEPQESSSPASNTRSAGVRTHMLRARAGDVPASPPARAPAFEERAEHENTQRGYSELVLLHQTLEVHALDARGCGGAGDVAAVTVEHRRQIALLEIV